MAKEIEVSPREALWAEYVENYKKSNPVKFAQKEANGEFKKIHTSFQGVKKTVKLANGQVRTQIF